jgi:hypothetical protein
MNRKTLLKSSLAKLASLILWLASTVLAFLCLFAVRDLLLWGLAAALTPPSPDDFRRFQAADTINAVHNCSIIILGIVALGVVLVGGDFFFRHFGKPRLVRTLVKLIALECLILIPWIVLFDPFDIWTVPV